MGPIVPGLWWLCSHAWNWCVIKGLAARQALLLFHMWGHSIHNNVEKAETGNRDWALTSSHWTSWHLALGIPSTETVRNKLPKLRYYCSTKTLALHKFWSFLNVCVCTCAYLRVCLSCCLNFIIKFLYGRNLYSVLESQYQVQSTAIQKENQSKLL